MKWTTKYSNLLRFVLVLSLYLGFYFGLRFCAEPSCFRAIQWLIALAALVWFAVEKFALKDERYGFWSFFTVVALLQLVVNLGVDYSDEAYYNGFAWFWERSKNLGLYTSGLSFRTLYLWFRLIGEPFFVWERLLFLTVLGLNGYIVHQFFKGKLLDLELSEQKLFWVILGAQLLSVSVYKFLIPYDNLPLFWSLVFFYLWFLALRQGKDWILILAAVAFVLAVYSRILIAPLLLVLPLMSLVLGRLTVRRIMYLILGGIAGLGVVAVMGVDLLSPVKAVLLMAKDWAESLCLIKDNLHRQEYLFRVYARDLMILSVIFVGVAAIYIFERFVIKSREQWRLIVWGFFWVVLIGLAQYKLLQGKPFVWFFIIAPVVFWFNFVRGELWQKRNAELIAVLVFLYLGTFYGSNVGLVKIYTSGASVFLVSVAFAHKSVARSRVFYVFLTALWVLALLFNFQYVHRDYYYTEQDKFYTWGSLKFMKTHHSKYQEVITAVECMKQQEDLAGNYVIVNKAFAVALQSGIEPQQYCYIVDPQKFALIEPKPRYVLLCTRKIGEVDWLKSKIFTFDMQKHYIEENVRLIKQYYEEACQSRAGIFILYKTRK